MTQKDKENVLHCLKVMIDEEVCEECNLYGTTGTDHCEKDCVRMAIEALQMEPCEDCISRQAVLEQTYNWSKDEFLRVTNPFDYLRKRINSLPSVNPQKPKMGHWIYICNSKVNGLKIVKCSECGKRTYGSGKYCPNCGAKMEEGE